MKSRGGSRWRQPLVLLGLLAMSVPARTEDVWLPAACRGARARSMGGCFAATSNVVDAHLFNPAGLAQLERRRGLKLIVDPVSPFRLRPESAPGDESYAEAAGVLAAIQRLEWRGRRLSLALGPVEWHPVTGSPVPVEERVARPSSAELAPSLCVGLALDHRVRLGVSATAYYDALSSRRRIGLSYGALFRANKWMDVGGHAQYMPRGALDARRALDQIGDGSINVGVAFHPLGREGRDDLILALDVRNVTQEPGLDRRQELHLGMENQFRYGPALRGGISWPVDETHGDGVPGLGAGIGWENGFPVGRMGLDLGVLWNSGIEKKRLWTASLRWSL